MTDKQIIFGVDVSKCPYAEPAYGSPKCRINGYVHCDGFRNCEYKQLKRKKQRIVELNKTIKAKEQECEELKDLANHNGRVCNERLDKIDELEHNINELNGQLDQLKAENEEWKNKLTKSIFEDGKKQIALDIAIYERDKFKQTLTEIKEIAENVQSFVDWNLEDDVYTEMNKILQKISECEVE